MDALKRCSKCHQELPATVEYFFAEKRRGPDALRSECRACARAQVREWREKNPEKRLEWERQHAAKTRDKRRESWREWRNRNLEAQRERERQVKSADPDRRKKVQEWRLNNLDKARQNVRRYMSRKAGRADDFTGADWQYALDYFGGCCAACGRPPGLWHTLAMDHWIPNSSPDCPGMVPANIIPLCDGLDGCNQSKHARDPEQWSTNKFGKKQARAILAKVHDFFSRVRQPTGV